MRNLIDKQSMFSCVIMAVLDSLALVIAIRLGLPGLLCVIISWAPSTLGGNQISRFVAFLSKAGIEAAAVFTAVFLAVGAGLLLKLGGVNVWENLPFYLLFGIVPTAVRYVIEKFRQKKAAQKIVQRLGSGENGLALDAGQARAIMEPLLGTNREITGKYSRELAASCENGTFVGKEKDGVISWLGIPYALPPTGERRWKKPEPAEPSSKVYEAYYYGSSAPQPELPSNPASFYRMEEDCLSLNIWAGRERKSSCPVLVWLNTFDWCTGGTASPYCDGDAFVKENPEILFVNVNFRLGILGNMDFTGVPGGGLYPDSCNLSLQDQIEALRWIRKNIADFGGDPDNVTLIGDAGGGTAVALLSVMKEAGGLFSKGVILGGTVFATSDRKTCENYRNEVKEYFHTADMEDFLRMDPLRLAKSVDELRYRAGVLPFCDGKRVPENLLEAYGSGLANGVSLIVSTAAQETNSVSLTFGGRNKARILFEDLAMEPFRDLSPEAADRLDAYVKRQYGHSFEGLEDPSEALTDLLYHYPMLSLCKAQSRAGGESRYMYWDQKSPLTEIGSTSVFLKTALLGKEEYSEYLGVVGDSLDFQAMRKMLVNFLKTGNPSLISGDVPDTDGVEWPPLSETGSEVMIMDRNGCRMDTDGFADRIRELMPMEKYLFAAAGRQAVRKNFI